MIGMKISYNSVELLLEGHKKTPGYRKLQLCPPILELNSQINNLKLEREKGQKHVFPVSLKNTQKFG